MNRINHLSTTVFFTWLLSLIFSTTSHAHLMAPHKGTLNFDNTGGYLVLSLPASAFLEFDENKDKQLTINEIKRRQQEIISLITKSIYLTEETKKTYLSGALLAPQKSHTKEQNTVEQIVVIGKFLSPLSNNTTLNASLFGDTEKSKELIVTASNKSSNLKHIFKLNEQQISQRLFH
ncbi:hypothetical protein C1E24_17305 [Pseudoalteromonas phenolica]|uniref:EF-hand domain-containing protein n=1 Tax=Pseudoalteromonas phenolica TaxID=161398 RepID=A0A5R9PZ60_9GAMM|nr:hypothetical protein [Pseudoalteromonas phenolica]TLX45672.1 hypothetical protein C1E24_17305 [Pseudoalteromonas phenolica]